MTALTLFASTFVLVFALGLQSLNVNRGQYLFAFLTSFVISSMQMIMLKLGPDANAIQITAFLSGGPFGIIAAMWVHPRFVSWLERRRHKRMSWIESKPKLNINSGADRP